jgi:monooxygenase
MRRLLVRGVARALPAGFDVARHFNPRYDPWDERLCLVPDGDLFQALSSGQAEVATGTIATVEQGGVRLSSGELLAAEILVTATGLNLQLLGGIGLSVDGEAVDPGAALTLRGLMISGVPNLALVFGYTNASWTLKADLICRYVVRLLAHMDAHGVGEARPVPPPGEAAAVPFIDLASGYVQRGLGVFPSQGTREPWRVHQSYLRDLAHLRRADVTRGMRLIPARSAAPLRQPVPAGER